MVVGLYWNRFGRMTPIAFAFPFVLDWVCTLSAKDLFLILWKLFEFPDVDWTSCCNTNIKYYLNYILTKTPCIMVQNLLTLLKLFLNRHSSSSSEKSWNSEGASTLSFQEASVPLFLKISIKSLVISKIQRIKSFLIIISLKECHVNYNKSIHKKNKKFWSFLCKLYYKTSNFLDFIALICLSFNQFWSQKSFSFFLTLGIKYKFK